MVATSGFGSGSTFGKLLSLGMAESNSGLQQSVRERDGDLDVLLQHLEIREDEEQDIVLEKKIWRS